MARLILAMGESGSGKTTSLRTLDPSTTYIIDADKKGLSWRGWRAQYSTPKHNYRVEDDNAIILEMLRRINSSPDFAHVKTVVVDTINGVMVSDEYHRRSERGYDKWQDLAWSIWGVIDYALTMRDDLTVVFMAHGQTERDDSGVQFTTVLNAKQVDGTYIFETRSPTSTAKAPMGLFETDTVPNDMAAVIAALKEYDGEAEEPAE